MRRPLIRGLLEEYVLERSPMVTNYVKETAKLTGLSEEEVRRSKPVREFVRRMLGLEPP
jgi:hypothetical protein